MFGIEALKYLSRVLIHNDIMPDMSPQPTTSEFNLTYSTYFMAYVYVKLINVA